MTEDGQSISNHNMQTLGLSTPEEVLRRVREWSSDLSDRDHLIRSTILEIHAELEAELKAVLFQILKGTIFHDDDEEAYEQACEHLHKVIRRMNFSAVYRILAPSLKAYPSDDFDSIQQITEVRNQVAHLNNKDNVNYKNRNPFEDMDALTELFVDAFGAREVLSKFVSVMIEQPRAYLEYYERFYFGQQSNAQHGTGAKR